jgi:rhodanese-related sulfurtransferase
MKVDRGVLAIMDDRQTAAGEAREPKKITVNEAWQLVQNGSNPFFLDTRNLKHYGQSNEKIQGSVRIWRAELAARIGEIPAERTIIACCNCHRENSSGKAVSILYENGFAEAYALLGGMDAWREAGLPLVPKED